MSGGAERCLRAIGLAVLVATSGTVLAHSEGEPGEESGVASMLMDCEHPPEDAVTSLPSPLDTWARIDCVQYGQKLVAAQGWHWRYPGSWTVRAEAPAWSPDASRRTPGAKYFRTVTIEPLDGDAIARAHARLTTDSVMYRDYITAPPARMYRVVAENNLGHDMEVFVPEETPDRLWAFLCVPECRPEYSFMIERR